MALYLYRSESPLKKSEREILEIIVKDLRTKYEHSDEFCFLFLNYECPGRTISKQMDATLIRKDAVINIEIKDFSGETGKATAQFDLQLLPSQKKLGLDRGELPFKQIEGQNYALMTFIYEHQVELWGGKVLNSPNDFDMCGYLVLKKLKKTDTSELKNKQYFLKLTDAEKFVKESFHYRGRDFLGKNPWMNLDCDFVKQLAKLLQLREVPDLNELENTDNELEHQLRDYLYGIKFNVDYVERPGEEQKLLQEKNILAIGAPGAGKSTLLKKLVKDFAQRELGKSELTRIPCLLQMVRVNSQEILKAVSREACITEEQAEQKLQEGFFWIVFDGVDEMKNFRENFWHVLDFIKDFPKNKYTISIRREHYKSDEYEEYFEELKNHRKFKEFSAVEIGELTNEQKITLILKRLGDKKSEESQATIETFLAKLPEILPLTIEMAVEIYVENGTLVYENEGRWFDEFFKARLKRECKILSTIGRNTDVLLDNVLVKLGNYAIVENDSFFEITLVYRFLLEEIGEKHTDYYDLLLRSEILELTEVDIPEGKTKRTEEQLKFYHKTYRDFYVAKVLIGKLNDKDWLDHMLKNNDEQRVLVMLCGIEPKTEMVDNVIKLIIEIDKYELACECLFNSGNYSSIVQNYVAEKMIQAANDNSLGKNELMRHVQKYGDRILVPKLHQYLDGLTEDDIIARIDWEFYKINKLGFEEISVRYIQTFRYGWISDRQKNDTLDVMACIPEIQTVGSQHLYYRVRNLENLESCYEVIIDEKVQSTFKGFLLQRIAMEEKSDDFIKCVNKDLNIFSLHTNEFYQWSLISVLVNFNSWSESITPLYKNVVNMVIEDFYHWSPNIQLRIVRNVDYLMDINEMEIFLIDILNEYACDIPIDIERLKKLGDDSHMGEHDLYADWLFFCDYSKYTLSDFYDDTYSTLIRCVAIESLCDRASKDYRKIILPYSFSENEKLKTVAEWAIKKMNGDTDVSI